MSSDGGDTTPGFRHPPRRSSRPPADVEELPEPDLQPIRSLHQYVAELHRDVRSARNESAGRIEGARQAIYNLGEKVDRLQAAVEGLRTCQDYAFKSISDGKRADRWAMGVMGLAILAALLLRMYGLIGV